MSYRLLVSIEVIEFIERLPSKTRVALRLAIRSIGRDPMGRSDALDRDDDTACGAAFNPLQTRRAVIAGWAGSQQ